MRLERMSTAVLTAPITSAMWRLPSTNAGRPSQGAALYERKSPPNSMTSVARNTHIPRLDASRCCSRSSNWCATMLGRTRWASAIALPRRLWPAHVIVRVVRGDGRRREVVLGRRRRCRPLERGAPPRVGAGALAVLEGPEQIAEWQRVADGEDRRARAREHVQHVELRRIHRVAARHAEIAEDVLREEREIEAEEDGHRGETAEVLRIETPRHLRPPVVQRPHVGGD